MKFTEAAITKFKPPTGKLDHIEFDDSMPGFGIRFRNGGAPSFLYQYKIGAKHRRISLGRVGSVTLTSAKVQAQDFAAQLNKAIDPVVVLNKKTTDASIGIESLMPEYLASMRKRGLADEWISFNQMALTVHWKPLHKFSLGDIDRNKVSTRHASLSETSGVRSADNCRAVLHRFYNWAIKAGKYEGFNPVAGTEKNGSASRGRDRLLKPFELRAIWNALGETEYHDILRLLMLTGQRRDEIGSLAQKEMDWPERMIDLPGSRTKNRLPHIVPVGPMALDILKRRKSNDRQFFFGRDDSGYSGWSRAKERLDASLPDLAPWTPHDFRRSLSTYMREKCGVTGEVVEAILNHVSGSDKQGVAGVYNKARYEKERRVALTKYEQWLAKVFSGKVK
jgi:integrase